jgi:hypothetical protein
VDVGRLEEVRFDVREGALNRARVLLHERRAVGAVVAITEEEVRLLHDLHLEEARGVVVEAPAHLTLEEVALEDLVDPHGPRQRLGHSEPLREPRAVELHLRVGLDRLVEDRGARREKEDTRARGLPAEAHDARGGRQPPVRAIEQEAGATDLGRHAARPKRAEEGRPGGAYGERAVGVRGLDAEVHGSARQIDARHRRGRGAARGSVRALHGESVVRSRRAHQGLGAGQRLEATSERLRPSSAARAACDEARGVGNRGLAATTHARRSS